MTEILSIVPEVHLKFCRANVREDSAKRTHIVQAQVQLHYRLLRGFEHRPFQAYQILPNLKTAVLTV